MDGESIKEPSQIWRFDSISSHTSLNYQVFVLDVLVVETSEGVETQEMLENAVCVRLAGVVLSLHHLSQSAILPVVTDSLIKVHIFY